MKTYKKWVESNVDLDKYLTEPCQIDEKLAIYMAEETPPTYSEENLSQVGDPFNTDNNGVYTYMTTSYINGKYFYLGILPEFKTEDL